MCILCVVQRWSRRVATMLPWLVIPLIGLWALSQLLPPGLRFEVTSPRLACVLVLLVTLFWYEVLMPQLSVWRARRAARLRERQLSHAIELQKLRRAATRRCRNCHTAYRDQNPGGGRFMCSSCGHISKRPVLELPDPPRSSGFMNGLFCSHEWSGDSHVNWAGSKYWVGSDDRCSAEKSYSGAMVFIFKLLSSGFFIMRWIGRQVFRVGSFGEDGSLDSEHRGSMKRENGMNCQESKGEKARRKAEEKRQARLEKEMLEEEERKQREEVARLVEERRRLRDEKLEAERRRLKSSAADLERENNRKAAEKKRQERKKDKDKGSSKSNSDGEELDRRASRESEKKRDFDKRIENISVKSAAEVYNRSHGLESGQGIKAATAKPSRYFDRVKGSFLSSSRGFNGAAFFGRSPQASATAFTKTSKPATGPADNAQISGVGKDAHSTCHPMGKSTLNGNGSISDMSRPVASDMQLRPTVPKKSWHQLFTRASPVFPCPDLNATNNTYQNGQLEISRGNLTGQNVLSDYASDNHVYVGQSLPSTIYPPVNSIGSASFPVADSNSLFAKEPVQFSVPEEVEHFEDPCYIPDPISLLGPVSESLDNFPFDVGMGFVAKSKVDDPRLPKNAFASGDVNRPSPIESPMSRLRVSEEKHFSSSNLSRSPKPRDLQSSSQDEFSKTSEEGTWQMWGSPLAPDALGLGGGHNWLLPIGQDKSIREDRREPPSHHSMISHSALENHVFLGTRSPQNSHVGNGQHPLIPCLHDTELWPQQSLFQPLPFDRVTHSPPVSAMDAIPQNELVLDKPRDVPVSHPFEVSSLSSWPTKDWGLRGLLDAGNSSVAGQNIEGLFRRESDAESLWAFK